MERLIQQIFMYRQKIKKPTVVTYHNYAKVTVGSTKMMGTNARIQIYKGGKWITVKTVKDYNCYKATTVKNLKPLTTYKFRTQAYANGTTGTPSDVVTLKTGSAVKPAVKSIKIVQKKKDESKRLDISRTLEWRLLVPTGLPQTVHMDKIQSKSNIEEESSEDRRYEDW